MYFGGSVVGKVSTIGIQISPIPPLLFTGGQIVRNLVSFSTSFKFEPPMFKNATRYPNAETNFLCIKWSPYDSAKFGEVGFTHPENRSVKVPNTLKLHAKTCYIVNDSAVDYSISLTFCTEFKRDQSLYKIWAKSRDVTLTFGLLILNFYSTSGVMRLNFGYGEIAEISITVEALPTICREGGVNPTGWWRPPTGDCKV